MLFVIIAHDGPDSAELRMQVRPAHLQFIRNSAPRVKMGGALMSDDGETMTGSLIIYEAPNLEAAKAWSANDPYRKQGVWQRIAIRPFRSAAQLRQA